MQANKKCATARIWAYMRDECPWASGVAPATWYRFSKDREGKHPIEHLSRFKGWIHAPSRQHPPDAPAGQWTDMLASTTSLPRQTSTRWPAGRMSGESSSISSNRKGQRSPRKRSDASRCFRLSNRLHEAIRPKTAWPYVSVTPSRCHNQYPNRNRQTQRRRSSSLAHMGAGPNR